MEKEKKNEFHLPEYYENRELSWLKFDARVLNEAKDKSIPLLERLKFVSITSSNLDEFFMVRVASLKDMVHADYRKRDIAGMTASEQLDRINTATRKLVESQYNTYNRSLVPLMAANGIHIGNTTEQYGIELLSFETKQLDLPSDNKAAVYERMISERENISATYTAEGSSEAQKIRNTTDKEVNVLLSEANKNAEILIAEGEAEYMKILSDAYADASKQDFYSFVRSLDALKASMTGDNKTVILSPDSPIAQIFYGR